MPQGGVWISFVCDCGEALSFQSFEKEGEKVRVSCTSCGRIWQQELTEHRRIKTLITKQKDEPG